MKSYLGDAYGAKTRFDYVLLNKNLVRLVSSLGGQKGSVFCDTENPHQNWMVEFDFSVYGRSSSGGEGFVFWYVKDTKPDKLDFYGHSSRFEGLALVFDTSDVQNNRYNPFIYGLTNNGRKDITDFRDYHSPNVNIGSCFRQYRNTGSPVYVKILYKDKKLRVDVDIHENGAKYVTCFETIADLPTGYHFGLSGKSDDRAPDDHSFYSFEAYELDPKPKKDNPSRPHEKEDIAAGNEFKMTDKLRQKIIETEKEIMKDYVAKEEPIEEPQLTAQTVRQLEENQFHIIEALNLIQDKLERDLVQPEVNLDALTPDDQNAFENRLNEELKVLGYED
ncbi:hypothetical protein HDV02_004212 [Globomyces sp. JEL0801]|nr:hypothetical protein HDV02_004212 [Globomyces sp. JEL0801]